MPNQSNLLNLFRASRPQTDQPPVDISVVYAHAFAHAVAQIAEGMEAASQISDRLRAAAAELNELADLVDIALGQDPSEDEQDGDSANTDGVGKEGSEEQAKVEGAEQKPKKG